MLKQLLKMGSNFSEGQVNNRFKTLANLLLTQCEIVKGNFRYDLLEIEFYYYNSNHPDTTTYKRIRLLIDAGADVNKTQLDGNGPLHFAAWSGNRFIGSGLIAAHAQVDIQNGNGETPLILAAREGDNEFVSLLVEHGANVNLADNLQHTALYYAGEHGYNEITEILLTAGAEG